MVSTLAIVDSLYIVHDQTHCRPACSHGARLSRSSVSHKVGAEITEEACGSSLSEVSTARFITAVSSAVHQTNAPLLNDTIM